MKYCVLIKGKKLTFWLKNCKKCEETLVVHTSKGGVRCMDCMRKQAKIDGRKPHHSGDHIFMNISGKKFLENYRAGLYEKVSIYKKRRTIKTCDNYYEP